MPSMIFTSRITRTYLKDVGVDTLELEPSECPLLITLEAKHFFRNAKNVTVMSASELTIGQNSFFESLKLKIESEAANFFIDEFPFSVKDIRAEYFTNMVTNDFLKVF